MMHKLMHADSEVCFADRVQIYVNAACARIIEPVCIGSAHHGAVLAVVNTVVYDDLNAILLSDRVKNTNLRTLLARKVGALIDPVHTGFEPGSLRVESSSTLRFNGCIPAGIVCSLKLCASEIRCKDTRIRDLIDRHAFRRKLICSMETANIVNGVRFRIV